MSKVRQHFEYAVTGEPSQECSLEYGKEPPKTDFGEGAHGEQSTPHSTEDEAD